MHVALEDQQQPKLEASLPLPGVNHLESDSTGREGPLRGQGTELVHFLSRAGVCTDFTFPGLHHTKGTAGGEGYAERTPIGGCRSWQRVFIRIPNQLSLVEISNASLQTHRHRAILNVIWMNHTSRAEKWPKVKPY